VITASLSSSEHTNVTRLVLDESGTSLESVLGALQTQNTDRIADSSVPVTYAVLTDTEPMTFARSITSIGKSCVESNLTSLASALEIEKDSMQEYERNDNIHRLPLLAAPKIPLAPSDKTAFNCHGKRSEQSANANTALPRQTDRDLRSVRTEAFHISLLGQTWNWVITLLTSMLGANLSPSCLSSPTCIL
jgi:hypothetical protein